MENLVDFVKSKNESLKDVLILARTMNMFRDESVQILAKYMVLKHFG